jgi:hypothetical protein
VDNVGVTHLGQRRGLVEKALDALAEGVRGFPGNALDAGVFQASCLVERQVFLDGRLLACLNLCCKIDNAEAAATEGSFDAVVVQQKAVGKRSS